jgi:hypothetical protein
VVDDLSFTHQDHFIKQIENFWGWLETSAAVDEKSGWNEE